MTSEGSVKSIRWTETIYNRLEALIMDKLVLQDRPGPFFRWLYMMAVSERHPRMDRVRER
jgi:hypothetical protein